MKTLLTALSILLGIHGYAATFTTVSSGFWYSDDIWENGIAPETENSDDIIINHGVILTEDITINQGGSLLINENSGICGHVILTLNNAELSSDGVIQLDIMNVASSAVDINDGNLVLTESAHLYSSNLGGGGYLAVNGGLMEVGPWFDCFHPLFTFETAIIEEDHQVVNCYPNPANHMLNVTLDQPYSDLMVQLIDVSGKVVQEINFGEGVVFSQVDISELNSGIYLLQAVHSKFAFTTPIFVNR